MFAGSGEIQTMVIEQMKKVLFPEGWGDFLTIYDMWYNTTEGEISPLGSGSDYASFYQNGIGCVSHQYNTFKLVSTANSSDRLMSAPMLERQIRSTITTPTTTPTTGCPRGQIQASKSILLWAS